MVVLCLRQGEAGRQQQRRLFHAAHTSHVTCDCCSRCCCELAAPAKGRCCHTARSKQRHRRRQHEAFQVSGNSQRQPVATTNPVNMLAYECCIIHTNLPHGPGRHVIRPLCPFSLTIKPRLFSSRHCTHGHTRQHDAFQSEQEVMTSTCATTYRLSPFRCVIIIGTVVPRGPGRYVIRPPSTTDFALYTLLWYPSTHTTTI